MNKLIVKPFVAIFVPLAFLAFVQVGCKKSSSGSSTGVNATLNNSGFHSQQTLATYSKSQHVFTIVGYSIGSGDTSAFELDLSNVPLNQAVDLTSGQTMYYYDTKNSFSYTGDPSEGHGTVSLTSFDTVNLKVAGTFSGVLQDDFSAADSLKVSGGQFNLSYVPTP
jgi:hypothetical protein